MGKQCVPFLSVFLLLFCSSRANQRQEQMAPIHFSQSVYNATIYENSAAKTYLESRVKMGIHITDLSWDVRYKIVSGDSENLFKAEEYVLGDFSFLRIRTKGGSTAILNREVKDHYLLTVKALERNTGAEARTAVSVKVLDTNDLRPLFSPTSYSIALPENTAVRTSIARVSATDADIGTNGEYYFSFRDWTNVFAVHPTSGVITLTGKLDFAETKLYEMEILAVDRGLKLYGSSGVSSVAKLTVRVEPANEHAPVITAVTLAPSDLEKDPTHAMVTVEDHDQGLNGEIASLSIVAGDPLQQFKVVRTSPGSKEYKIKAVKKVDWQSQLSGYNLTLQAKDKGNPPLFSSVKVLTVLPPLFHLGPPKFERSIYRVNLSEFAPLHTPVVMVTATPVYSHLKYFFKYKMEKSGFSLNPDTGLITTTGPVHADRTPKIELEVITSDKKATSKVVIDVTDMNNNAPEFRQTSYKASVDEHVPVGSSVLLVSASDLDSGENGYVTYSIANAKPHPFAIDYFTGVISTAEDLDYELMPRIYSLRVRASDWGSSFRREVEAPVTITLNNLNDNKPQFETVDCKVVLPRDLRVGEQIMAVSAIDADELQLVQYEIKSGNDLDLFDLNQNSGVLSLKRSLNSGDAAKEPSHALLITADDGENVTPPMITNITVATAQTSVLVQCVDTGVAKMLAKKLLEGTNVHNHNEPDDNFVDIHSINRHPPQFVDSVPTVIDVKEDLPVGARVSLINATDADSGFNGKLVYVISGGNDESKFVIDMDTGWLKVYAPLDREKTSRYRLNISAYDLGIPQKSSSHFLDVNVLDTNDNSPEFLQDSYSVEIPENTELGTNVIQVEARDKDLGVNGEVRYSFVADTDQFAIDEMTGVVKVKNPLDREMHPVFLLKVAACDQAIEEPRLISTVSLKIILEDVNDNPPKFVPPNYRVRVREDLPVGTVVMWLEAYDPDVGQSSQVRYSLVDDGDGNFDVDKLSGAVRIAQNLDYEKKQVYNVTARAKDKGKPVSLSSVCNVEVDVVDVNENLYRPWFPSFADRGSVKEDAAVGTSVMRLVAQDEDQGRDGEITYSIHDGSGLGIFTIHGETGVISTLELLDHESTPHYWLTVYATDGGAVPLSSSVAVYIQVQDVNDNAPQTSEPVYYPSVMENSPKDVSVIRIQAFDPDSSSGDKLSFKISSGNPQGFFAIDPKTGTITTTSRKLDREQQQEHVLEVTVTDQGVPAKSTVVRVIVGVLDENDNRPQFLEKIYKIKLPEREKPERERSGKREPVYRVLASDRDDGPNAEISYSIEEGDEHGQFFIEPKTGLVSSKKVSSAGEYDILTIKAVDNGRPQKSSTCRLHVEWTPKPEPSSKPLAFDETSFMFSVMESDPVAHMVGVITTEPTNSPVWFDITGDTQAKDVFYISQMACDLNCTAEGGNYDSRFDVGKGSGTIILARPLNAEQKSNYNLTVEATDGTKSISTQVHIKVIDTNNHRPQFSQTKYQITVPESIAVGAEILRLNATDRDEKNKLTYTLLSSTDPFSLKKFRLDPGTGALYTADKLDQETMHRHTLTVMVRDQDVPVKRNLARVIVDIEDANDNAPWFTRPSYSASVLDSAAVGSAVVQVTALDKDKGLNAELLYSIESGNVANSFAIDPVLGTITLSKELDRKSKKQFELAVIVSDKGQPPLSASTTVRVAVTVSDNAKPRFTHEEFSAEISEAARVRSFVSVITASSLSSVFYQIKSGNVNNTFDINPNSGVVVTQRPLDYETLPLYRLIVQATNLAGMASNTTLLVLLKDENDNPPVFARTEFTGAIGEGAPANSLVLTLGERPLVIRASDADSDTNARLVYQIVEPFAHDYFAIDSSTGAIRVSASLDHEQRSVFHFSVQVHDLGKPRLFAETAAKVTVEVIDINDCAPRFSHDVYRATLMVPTYQGVKVIALNATDEDSNSRLIFSIVDGNIGDKFRIDSVTGVIYIVNTTQLRSRYELSARVSDGKFVSTSSVKINVRENTESNLRFTQGLYSAFVQENSSEKKTLAVVATLGGPINEPLFYAILNPDKKFRIGHTSGVLSTTGMPFDREEQSTFDVVVEVTREGETSGVAHVLVKVSVEDVNDSPPVFVNLPYHALVQMDAEVGHVIREVTAVDGDLGENAEIHYQLKEPHECFEISAAGIITLKRPLEQDRFNTEFLINVVASDRGEPVLSSEVEVLITVVSKAAPLFEKPFYSIEIPESVQLHTVVVHVQANASEGTRVVYTISEGDPLRQFSIDFNTGVVHVLKPLDYETRPAYKLSVRASDSLTGAHADMFVDIILEDVNDNSPVFKSKEYEVGLSEASIAGTSVLQVGASDPDSGNNKVLFYELVEDEGKASGCFSIDRDTGVIWTSCALDHETAPRHVLRVRAVDGGVPALSAIATVTVDVTDLNDNAPAFNQQLYDATVSELAPRGHFVTQVQASDADSSDFGKLEYSIFSGNEDRTFAIDTKSGQIVIFKHQALQMEPLYNLNVSVSDGVFRSWAVVRVTVIGTNFHSPSFLQVDYLVELAEHSPVGTLVAETKAVDHDPGMYGHVTYYIVNDFARDKFSIDQDGQIFTLESLDRENAIERVIPISLMAKDGGGKVGFCTVNVILTDVNDNAPQFRAAEYRVNVASDMPLGTTVIKVAASDLDEGSNADIAYAIEADAESVKENFEIHSFSGDIFTKESLVGLENELYTFYVKAVDAGHPSRQSFTAVYIRILSPEVPVPKFVEPQYRFAVPEDLPVGSEIDVIQAESEEPVFYSLARGNTPEGNQGEVFVVERDTGRLKLEKSLDHETTKWYQLQLQAQNQREGGEVVSTVDVHVQLRDVNDNSPQFESNLYKAFVVENLPGGTSVIQVKASDLDSGTNGHVTYSLDQDQESAEISELFAISSETGWITTLRELDRETRSSHTVNVVATDRGESVRLATSARVEVTVADVNDNPPRFAAEVYKGTVSEDDPPPSGVVAILSTTDADAEDVNKQVSCYITGGDPLGQFAIEHVQNEWKVSVRKPLDREERDKYLLNITATDGTFMAQAVVEVKVLDANDNSPVCEKAIYAESVPEDSPADKLILQVSATDDDIRSNAEISYKLFGAGSDAFKIDSRTGELKTLLPLDREERALYNLTVRASDGGRRYCEAVIEITVEDANDNAPQFTSDPISITVFENTGVSTFVARIEATDRDVGINSDILYSLVDSAEGHFSIDRQSGIISLEKPLDRETRAMYTLRALAADQGTPHSLSSICSVMVSVVDITDNPPVFERREYVASVPEDVGLGVPVLRVFAASRDAQANAEISYAIVSGNERGMFSINAHTGDIFVIEGLDYEISHEYYLTVEATDGGVPSLSDMATVNINLTDVNDNSPVFSQGVYSAVVSEDVELGKTVVTVMAEDADGPANSRIHFSIVSGNQGSDFSVDSAKGEVKVARQLDREKISGYTLTLLASDNGNPARSTSATVNIDVSDVNDNPPVFSQANYSLVIQENRPAGTTVLQLSVTDRDASHNGPPFSFTIAEGNDGNAFQITQQGAVLAMEHLDRKMKDHYLLHLQVADSGKPPLFSSAFVSVRVIEESVYPPAVLPLDVFISTAEEEYPGGVLGKVHATDQDVYDTLTYTLVSEPHSPFSVSSADGKLVAHGGLDAGHYPLNVTVSDGRFSATSGVHVHVRRVTQRALNNSVALRLAGVTPEDFIGDYWRGFQRALRTAAGVRRSDVQVVSLQPFGPPGGLDVLLTLEKLGTTLPYRSREALLRKLNASVASIEEMTGVHIAQIVDKVCAGLDCPLGFCDEVITLDKSAMSTYSTARLSFVTPRHRRTAVCLCTGGKCPVLKKLPCASSPCPEGTVCVAEQEGGPSRPDGRLEKCSDGPALTFGGKGYVRFRLTEKENKEEMRLSLRLRTFSSHATIMYAKGTDFSILEIVNGRLQFRFDCGSGPGLVSVHSAQVSDGEWHAVSLEVDGNHARLALDRVHAASGTAPGALRTLNLDGAVSFGGRAPSVGLQGCLDAVVLNGRELYLGAESLVEVVGVSPGCALAPTQGCSSDPCKNGGTCSPLPNGGYFCQCSGLFVGTHCEMGVSPCASNPCLYGGTCVPRSDDFYCQCRGQYSGKRCQLGPYCKDNPCKNSGRCIDSLDGPVCECEPGFQGERCLGDVDECVSNPCSNGGRCLNTLGSYSCNCTLGYTGRLCELRAEIRSQLVSTSWNIGLEEVVGMVVFVLSIFLLVLLFVLIRKRACQRKKPEPEKELHRATNTFLQRPYFDAKLSRNIYSDVPPQVPVRPISYTPSIPSDSRNNLDRNSFEGSTIPEHPEFSTFNPDSHGHRKAVAVCSVAPNLPPPPPSNSPSDSDSIQKPSWDYDYDAKVVDLEPCLTKKPVEDRGCQHYNTHGSISEVHSLSSFQSESCDDNDPFPAHDLRNHRGYHWDTSDWMPSVQLPGIQELPQYEVVETLPPLYSDHDGIDTDYYPGGCDIDSDFPPLPDDFPSHEELPPPPGYHDRYETLRPPPASPGSLGQRQRLYPPQPCHPGGFRGPFAAYPGSYRQALEAPATSCSDVSACCEESEAMVSDYESGDEGQFDHLKVLALDSQQHTEV